MPSTFFGLELGKRALTAQQLALDVTGHNISNAGSAGYSRQIANIVTPPPYTIAGAGHGVTLGTGADVGSVTRARDSFVDTQFRAQSSLQAFWKQKQDGLQKVQGMMNEPSVNSLHGDMDALWTAFGDLAINPENAGARSVVQQRSIALSGNIRQTVGQVQALNQNFQDAVTFSVKQVNDITDQITKLNDQIKKSEVNGDNPNDLRDQRDSLVDQLSKFFAVTVIESKDLNFTDRQVNNYSVKIGSHILVNNSSSDSIKLPVDFITTPLDIKWSSDGSAVHVGDGNDGNIGSIKASFDMLNYLNTLKGKYDQLAQGIADAVNAIHVQGYDLNGSAGGSFFTYTAGNAGATIDLNSSIKANPALIAAADQPPTGLVNTSANGGNALRIASLKSDYSGVKNYSTNSSLIGTPPFNTGLFTQATSISDYYGAVVAGVGVDGQQADRMVSSTGVLVDYLSNQRQSLSGVSLDEEMTNLVRFQKSYSAAARLVTMMDDMLETIVNKMGVTR